MRKTMFLRCVHSYVDVVLQVGLLGERGTSSHTWNPSSAYLLGTYRSAKPQLLKRNARAYAACTHTLGWVVGFITSWPGHCWTEQWAVGLTIPMP